MESSLSGHEKSTEILYHMVPQCMKAFGVLVVIWLANPSRIMSLQATLKGKKKALRVAISSILKGVPALSTQEQCKKDKSSSNKWAYGTSCHHNSTGHRGKHFFLALFPTV
jgi:hypothetical protein